MLHLRDGAYRGPPERGELTVVRLREGDLYALDQPICTEASMCKMEARKKCPISIHLASSVRNLIERKVVSSTCDIGHFMLFLC